MNLKLVWLMAIMLLLGGTVGVAQANGNSPGHLGSKGWNCFNAGPSNWVHCLAPGSGASSATLTVKVFDTEDPSDTGNNFLGTELLLRADLYNGQPCPQDNLLDYHPMDLNGDGVTDYYACHHFATGHH